MLASAEAAGHRERDDGSPVSAVITIRDETASGQLVAELSLMLPAACISMRDLIATRVRFEVEAFNARSGDEVFRGLVQPSGAEQVPTGFKLKQRRQVDAQEQVTRALEAFERNGFFVVVDDRQVDSLDDVVAVRPATRVSFVKLVPLVGG